MTDETTLDFYRSTKIQDMTAEQRADMLMIPWGMRIDMSLFQRRLKAEKNDPHHHTRTDIPARASTLAQEGGVGSCGSDLCGECQGGVCGDMEGGE